jgi:hypothetical protein
VKRPQLVCALLVLAVQVGTIGVSTATVSKPLAKTHAANGNFNGRWKVTDAEGAVGYFVVTNENVKTGSFAGSLQVPAGTKGPSSYPITAGSVTGNNFTATLEYPGTVVGYNGLQFSYVGSFHGNAMSIKVENYHAWIKGKVVPPDELSTDGTIYKGYRGLLTINGEVDLGCGGSGGSCSASSDALAGVEVTISGDDDATATTDQEGKWSVDVPEGTYTVTPTSDGFTYAPGDRTVKVTKNITVPKFSACVATTTLSASVKNGFGASAPHARPATAKVLTLIGQSVPCAAQVLVQYTPSTREANVVWVANAWYCDKTTRHYWNYHLGGPVYYSNEFGHSPNDHVDVQANGEVLIHAHHGADEVVLVDIKPGGKSATATVSGTDFAKELVNRGSAHSCEPQSGVVTLNPSS